jgi:hypothetical protein
VINPGVLEQSKQISEKKPVVPGHPEDETY